MLQNGMSMAITVLILCVPWYQVNKNSQTNTNCMYIHSYEDLIIWYNDKTFFCWLLLVSYWWFPMRLPYKSRPADMCILWCLAIEVTAMVQPTKIGITRKLYRPNLLFANVHHIKIRIFKQGVAFWITVAANKTRGKFLSGIWLIIYSFSFRKYTCSPYNHYV